MSNLSDKQDGTAGGPFFMASRSLFITLVGVVSIEREVFNAMERIRLGIQKKKGRLYQGSCDLLRSCGLNFKLQERKADTPVSNFPMEIWSLRDDNVMSWVEIGALDLGIIGENLIEEYQPKIELITKLGFGKCRLTLGVYAECDLTEITQLSGSRVVTDLPHIVNRYFSSRGVNIRLFPQKGDEEPSPKGLKKIFPDIYAATAITDSGKTMRENGVKELLTIQEFEAVLIANPSSFQQRGSRRIIDQFLSRIGITI